MGMWARWHTSVNQGRRRGMEKQKSVSPSHSHTLSSQSVNQSVSKASKQASKPSTPSAHPCAPILSSTKGPPPGPNSQSCQITGSLPQKRSGARRTVEGGGGQGGESRIADRQTNCLGGPHLELDTKGSLTRSSKGTPSPCHVGIRRRGNQKGGRGCGVGHWPID